MNEQIKRTLRLFFKKEDNIRLAFLIGSFATGKSRPDSDVDVAVLFGRIPDHMKILDLRERLSEGLKRDIDLVILNEAGPIIRMQALKTGIRLRAEKGAYEDFFRPDSQRVRRSEANPRSYRGGRAEEENLCLTGT
jgi:predicted nucleotidyltransferase